MTQKIFKKNEIWAYPTDTSFGLGVRADDSKGLEKLQNLKGRDQSKFFSLMVRDWEMLCEFAEIPQNLSKFFFEGTPKTVILKPKKKLPKSKFWPEEKVAFRICALQEIAQYIIYPITATSANFSGEPAIYSVKKLSEKFEEKIKIYNKIQILPEVPASEIWDFQESKKVRLR